jgi:hypothetical protein
MPHLGYQFDVDEAIRLYGSGMSITAVAAAVGSNYGSVHRALKIAGVERRGKGGRRPKPAQVCAIEGCEREARTRGWCEMHYHRWYRKGDPGEAEERPRFGHRRTSAGRAKKITPKGYVKIWLGVGHPLAHADGYAYEHRLVMAEWIGRALAPEEVVHHVREDDLQDNARGNLWLFPDAASHRAWHLIDREGPRSAGLDARRDPPVSTRDVVNCA